MKKHCQIILTLFPSLLSFIGPDTEKDEKSTMKKMQKNKSKRRALAVDSKRLSEFIFQISKKWNPSQHSSRIDSNT